MNTASPNMIQSHVIDAYRQVFPDEAVNTDSAFFDFGGDSLSVVALCALLEKKLGQEVHPSLVIYFPTVEALAKELSS